MMTAVRRYRQAVINKYSASIADTSTAKCMFLYFHKPQAALLQNAVNELASGNPADLWILATDEVMFIKLNGYRLIKFWVMHYSLISCETETNMCLNQYEQEAKPKLKFFSLSPPTPNLDHSSATMCCTSNPVGSTRGSLMPVVKRWSQTSVTPRRSTLATSCLLTVSRSLWLWYVVCVILVSQSAMCNTQVHKNLFVFVKVQYNLAFFFYFTSASEMALCPNEWIITSFAIPNTGAGGGCHCSAVIESSDHFKRTLFSTQRRKPKGRRTVCPRSGSLQWWTNLS